MNFMKKLFLFATIFVGGLFGMFGWIIANVLLHQPGGVSSVASALRGSPGAVFICLFFMVMSVSGLLLAILEVLKDKD